MHPLPEQRGRLRVVGVQRGVGEQVLVAGVEEQLGGRPWRRRARARPAGPRRRTRRPPCRGSAPARLRATPPRTPRPGCRSRSAGRRGLRDGSARALGDRDAEGEAGVDEVGTEAVGRGGAALRMRVEPGVAGVAEALLDAVERAAARTGRACARCGPPRAGRRRRPARRRSGPGCGGRAARRPRQQPLPSNDRIIWNVPAMLVCSLWPTTLPTTSSPTGWPSPPPAQVQRPRPPAARRRSCSCSTSGPRPSASSRRPSGAPRAPSRTTWTCSPAHGLLRVVRTRRVRAIEERFYGRTARMFFVAAEPTPAAARTCPATSTTSRWPPASPRRPSRTGALWGFIRHARISEDQASAFWERMAALVEEFDRLPRSGETDLRVRGRDLPHRPPDAAPAE